MITEPRAEQRQPPHRSGGLRIVAEVAAAMPGAAAPTADQEIVGPDLRRPHARRRDAEGRWHDAMTTDDFRQSS